jgi:uncharacterized protein (TIGR02646 family)
VIAIHKGAPPPTLLSAGKKHADELCTAYDAEPKLYRSGKRKMNVRKSIYASKAVRAALDDCQHGKCCYCETRIQEPYADKHVEHWRPKLSSRQSRNQTSIWPGYYWLAYSWDNLLLSCAFCNRDNKRDRFPLKNPAARARNHRMRIEDEVPAILKPDGGIDPFDHIKFHQDVPVKRTALGRVTIEVLRLDSPKHRRNEYLKEEIERRRQTYIELYQSDDPRVQRVAERARRFLEAAVRPERPYSAMVAAYLAANPLPDRPTKNGQVRGRSRTAASK